MNKNSVLKHFLFAVAVVLFASCDDDFNELGTNIVGIDNFNFESKEYGITAVQQDIGAVESTNLPVNPLGIYDNPVFGKTIANFATQLQLSTVNPTIDLDLQPQIESVILTVPYYSTQLTLADGLIRGTYELDSIYAPEPTVNKMKLSVYESGYFIRDINPADQLAQAYFTDQDSDFNSAKIGSPLNNDSDVAQNNQFFFSNIENVEETTSAAGVVTTSRSTGMKLNLSTAFFDAKIFHAPAGKLLNNNVFKDYMRGLYFRIEENAGQKGSLAMLNFKAGKITIKYREYPTKPGANPDQSTKVEKSIVLNLTGNSVSLINQDNPVIAPGSDKIFLKGGANNSMAVIDIFNANELNELRANKWLINDAAITFTIDKTAMATANSGGKAYEPLRVYLYDLNNKRSLIDYGLDASANTSKPKFGKMLHGGIITRETGSGSVNERRGVTYKVRITKHIMNLVNQDSTNVRLGLVVTEDINNTTNKRVKNPALGGKIKVVPLMSAVHPLGTVLYGSNAADVTKRPKFEIYYTKPKQN